MSTCGSGREAPHLGVLPPQISWTFFGRYVQGTAQEDVDASIT